MGSTDQEQLVEPTSPTAISENDDENGSEYSLNIFKMTIMWSACSFSNYLLNFLNKYLEGSIFVNNYYEGIAGILATAAGTTCYLILGKKKAFTVSFSLALFGGTCIYLLESGLYQPPVSFVDSFSGS